MKIKKSIISQIRYKLSAESNPIEWLHEAKDDAKQLIIHLSVFIIVFVRKYHWFVVSLIFAILFVFTLVQLNRAKAERDSLSKHYTELVDSIHKVTKEEVKYVNCN